LAGISIEKYAVPWTAGKQTYGVEHKSSWIWCLPHDIVWALGATLQHKICKSEFSVGEQSIATTLSTFKKCRLFINAFFS
jgi:hypothetical protein